MKKTVALITACVLMLTCCVFASAAGFSDMAGANWDWARETVDTLAEQGLLKGIPTVHTSRITVLRIRRHLRCLPGLWA